MSENNQEKSETSAVPLDCLVMQDIIASMRAVVESDPICNDGSFALKILWDIYEPAADYFNLFEEVMALTDAEVEQVFNEAFPVFIAEYPKIMLLDA